MAKFNSTTSYHYHLLKVITFTYILHSLAHVSDVGAAGADGGQLLPLAEPLLNLDGILAHHLENDMTIIQRPHYDFIVREASIDPRRKFVFILVESIYVAV